MDIAFYHFLKIMPKFLFLFLFCLSFIFFGCQKKETPIKRLNINFYMEPKTLDPRKSGDLASSEAIFLLFCGLTEVSSSGTIEMALAKSYELSSDKKRYTFHLRDAKWSDGRKITSYDFEKSWKKALDPKFPSLCAELFYPIKNAEKAAKNEVGLDEVGINAIDEKTLVVQLTEPTPYFLSLVSFCVFFPLPSHVEEKVLFASDTKIVTSGPFSLKKWVHNDEMVLKKNTLHWNESKIKLDEIHISFVSNENTALQMYENGQLDWIGTMLSPLPADSMASLLKRKDLQISPIGGTSFCAFNTEKFPFNNKNIRKAFGRAINRKAIIQNITQGHELIATRCVPPVLTNNKNISFYKDFDLLEARQLFQKGLEELKVKKEDIRITLTYGSSILFRKLAEVIQQDWMKTFGIYVKLEQVERKVLIDRLHNHDFQSTITFWIAQYNDPMNILNRFKYKTAPKNYPLYHNDKYIELLDFAQTTANVNLRSQLLEKAEEIILDEMPIAPIYHHNYITLTNPRIKGFSIGPLGDLHFEKIEIK